MKKLILFITFILGSNINTFSQDLSQPTGGGTLDIVLVSPGDGYSIMNFEGDITGYGTVYVKFKVASINTSKSWNIRWSRQNYSRGRNFIIYL